MKKLGNLFVIGAFFISAPISLYAQAPQGDDIAGLIYDLKAEVHEHGDPQKLHILLDRLTSVLASSARERELQKQFADMRKYIEQLQQENQQMRLSTKDNKRRWGMFPLGYICAASVLINILLLEQAVRGFRFIIRDYK